MKLPEDVVRRIRAAKEQHGSYRAVAAHYDVPEEAVRRVLAGSGANSKNYQRLLEAFQFAPVQSPPATGLDLTRLAELRGMATAVLQMLYAVAAQQQQVVDGLAAWAPVLEGEQARHHPDAEKVKQSAAAALDRARSSESPSHPSTGAAAHRTKAPRSDTSTV